ncbi:Phosphoglycerate/bisphosphoglycerate mutase family protein isoform 1 [Hibiscus syriacus]|uniref:Phosphoglycerate/bisphosphoglycerate mutase family protein isoform 1 n=1 Tax=Hibiscus syriacus TaxID=106335 RepID=A0A6A2YSR8_HIBSY|nr:Phosphoglycerate/bisphosphoglycerate mutase family protein isoform 1 [Hibiscus syriacus]
MRDIVSCFSENAVNVSQSPRSSYSSNACISPTPTLLPSVQNSVVVLCKVILSTHKQVFIKRTWCKNQIGQTLSINFNDDPSPCFNLSTNLRFFRKMKGNKAVESDHSNMEIFWDLSAAKYKAGPEPVNGFYVIVMVDSEISLMLGDMAEEEINKKFKTTIPVAITSFISRHEHCLKHPVLLVCIDDKTVVRVKRLQWNFRGNQTILVDGLLVGLMWDVHDWLFNPAAGSAVFMFRTRSEADSRLWVVQKDEDRVEFSFLFHACHPRASEAIRTSYARASEGSRASYARESEGSRARVGRPECMGRPECTTTYKVARRAWRPMCWDVHVPCNTFILSV